MNAIVLRVRNCTLALCLGVMSLAIRLDEALASESAAVGLVKVTSPVELGPSAKARCNRPQTTDGRYQPCADALHLLALMNAEPRDARWAAKMEGELTDWVQSLASQGISSRNIECRLSLCFVEVGSSQQELLEMNSSDENKRKIFRRLFMYSKDVDDPTGGDIVVIFKRYCRSLVEILDHEGRLLPNADAAAGKGC